MYDLLSSSVFMPVLNHWKLYDAWLIFFFYPLLFSLSLSTNTSIRNEFVFFFIYSTQFLAYNSCHSWCMWHENRNLLQMWTYWARQYAIFWHIKWWWCCRLLGTVKMCRRLSLWLSSIGYRLCFFSERCTFLVDEYGKTVWL